MKQYDIWNEVLETLGFKFAEEYIINKVFIASIYKIDNETSKLYVNFLIDGWEYYETFQNKNKELFRAVKLKYLLD